MQEVIIKFDERGKIEVETKGFVDGSCLRVKEDLERLLGKATNVRLKREAKIQRKVRVKQ